jgi:hypothetical protein
MVVAERRDDHRCRCCVEAGTHVQRINGQPRRIEADHASHSAVRRRIVLPLMPPIDRINEFARCTWTRISPGHTFSCRAGPARTPALLLTALPRRFNTDCPRAQDVRRSPKTRRRADVAVIYLRQRSHWKIRRDAYFNCWRIARRLLSNIYLNRFRIN